MVAKAKKKSKPKKKIKRTIVQETKPKPPGYVFGRPTEYKSEYCDLLVEHMREGLSFESFAAIVGTHKDTLYEWAKKHADFADAKKIAFDLCRLWWEHEGRTAHNRGKDFNAAMWVYNMKCRFRKEWGDKVEIDAEVNIENLEGFETLKPKKNDKPANG